VSQIYLVGALKYSFRRTLFSLDFIIWDETDMCNEFM